MEIEVSAARAEDVPAVEQLVREAYEPYVERIGRKPGPLLDDYATIVGQGRALVARDRGRIVGLLITSVRPDHLLVENVAVADSVRGTGLGARLLRIAEEQARAEGLDEIRLYTHELMTENVAYYPRHGFVETHRRTDNGFPRAFFSRRLPPRP